MKQVRQSVPLVTLVSENREIIYDSETRLLCGLQAQALAATAETARPLFHALTAVPRARCLKQWDRFFDYLEKETGWNHASCREARGRFTK